MTNLSLTRRTLSILESLREPHKADPATNRARKIDDKFAERRFRKGDYNRRQRDLYKKRVPGAITRKRKPLNGKDKIIYLPPGRRLRPSRLCGEYMFLSIYIA